MEIEVSNGELLDKLSILEIKTDRIQSESKLDNVKNEFCYLDRLCEKNGISISLCREYDELLFINNIIWDLENIVRDLTSKKDFGESFISVARMIHECNDKRYEIKKKINDKSDSTFNEIKSY